MKIVIADDDEMIRELMTGFLKEEMGHELFVAQSGPEALELYRTHRPDLVITDGEMGDPHTGGLWLTREIRKTDKCTPIFMFTASPINEIFNLFTQGTLAAFFEKPNFESLTAKVNEIFSRKGQV